MTPLNKTLSLLKEARAIIVNPARWTQCSGARDAGGFSVHELSPHAVSYCSLGVLHAINVLKLAPINAAIEMGAGSLLRAAMGMPISRYNDTHSHAEVLSKWDEAIANLEARA